MRYKTWLKKNRFEIKNETVNQGQSIPKSIGTSTVLRCIFGPNLESLTSNGGYFSRGRAQNGVNFEFLSSIWPWKWRSIVNLLTDTWQQTHTHIHRHRQRKYPNLRPKLISGKNENQRLPLECDQSICSCLHMLWPHNRLPIWSRLNWTTQVPKTTCSQCKS